MRNIEGLADLGESKLRGEVEKSLKRIESDVFEFEEEDSEFMKEMKKEILKMHNDYYIDFAWRVQKKYGIVFEDLMDNYRKNILPKLGKYLGGENEH